MEIQDTIRNHRKKWIEANQWQDPNLTDCLDFMATMDGDFRRGEPFVPPEQSAASQGVAESTDCR